MKTSLLQWKTAVLSATLLCSAGWVAESQACSLVFSNDNSVGKVFSRSMDLYTSDMPKLAIVPRGINRTGETAANPIQWKSKYGSVVVTAFNSDAVTDGMNEKGLSAHLLYLHDAKYEPRNAEQKGLANILWAQYMLDNYKTVSEALNSLNTYQIESTMLHHKEWPLHLALQDATGDSAIVELINGKITVHHGSEYRIMTNEPTYDKQLANLKNYKLFGGTAAMPGDTDPMSRFVRASSYLKTLPSAKNEQQAVADTLAVLRTAMVSFGAVDTSTPKLTPAWPTRWVSAGDLTHKVYYFNSTQAPNIVWIDLNKVDFSAGRPVLMLDPAQSILTGDVSKQFVPFKG